MRYLRVKDWDKIYENNRTRELKQMAWIPVPNKHDGDGYTILVDRKNGAEALGAWLAILQVASKCDTRGTLLRDKETPHTPQSIARITRLRAESIEGAIAILVEECKWLEYVELNEISAGSCGNHAGSCGEVPKKGMEGNGKKEGEGRLSPTDKIILDGELKRIGKFLDGKRLSDYPKESSDYKKFVIFRDRRNLIKEQLGIIA